MKINVPNLWKGVFNLFKLSLLAFGGLMIFFGAEIILSGYIMFGDSFESRWGYLFLFIASVFIVIGGIILYFFLGHKEDEYIQKYRDIYPSYESIYHSPADSVKEEKVLKDEDNKVDVTEKQTEDSEKKPLELGYSQPSERGNVQAYSNPFYTMMDNPELMGMGGINPSSPYTAKAGEDKDNHLILPHPIWLAILFGIALGGGMMSFYVMTRYDLGLAGFLTAFSFIDLAFILCAFLPAFIWLAFLSRLTKKNPIKMHTIYVVFALGLLSAVPALIINTLFDYNMGRTIHISGSAMFTSLVLIAVIAPFNEEFCKALGLVFLREELETPMYGFIFGMTLGLGFSLVENVNYEFFVIKNAIEYTFPFGLSLADNVQYSWATVTFGRSAVGPLVHGLGVGLVGYAAAYARERKQLVGYLAIPLAYLGAVLIHGLWNGGNVLLSGSWLALFNIYLVITYFFILMIVLYHLWKGRSIKTTIMTLLKRERGKGSGKKRSSKGSGGSKKKKGSSKKKTKTTKE